MSTMLCPACHSGGCSKGPGCLYQGQMFPPSYPPYLPPIPAQAYYTPQLTLRDLMAVACLAAIYEHHSKFTDRAAELAYEQADEMLKARDKPGAASRLSPDKGDSQ